MILLDIPNKEQVACMCIVEKIRVINESPTHALRSAKLSL
jgi:hypothetical protein